MTSGNERIEGTIVCERLMAGEVKRGDRPGPALSREHIAGREAAGIVVNSIFSDIESIRVGWDGMISSATHRDGTFWYAR